MMAAVRGYHLLMNVDREARAFIAAYGNAGIKTSITSGGAGGQTPVQRRARSLAQIVEADLKGEAGEATRRLLETTSSWIS